MKENHDAKDTGTVYVGMPAPNGGFGASRALGKLKR